MSEARPRATSRTETYYAGLMIFAAIVEIFLGVKAEGQFLESVATPLTAVENRTDPATA